MYLQNKTNGRVRLIDSKGYLYSRTTGTGSKEYWRCLMKSSLKCRGIAHVDKSGYVEWRGFHAHPVPPKKKNDGFEPMEPALARAMNAAVDTEVNTAVETVMNTDDEDLQIV